MSGGRYIALLRGINVGGKNRLPLAELAAMFRDAGCDEVRTYIQSGNVVFVAPPRVAGRVAEGVARRIAASRGLRVPVILRTSEELVAITRGNPFLAAGADPDELHVMFLATAPPAAKIAQLDPRRSPPDELAVRGREVYLRLPNGVGRSKLTNDYFDAKLGTTSTSRNWRTVLKLVALAAG